MQNKKALVKHKTTGAQIALSYFFEAEAIKLLELSEECAMSRLFPGIHCPTNNALDKEVLEYSKDNKIN